MKNPSTDSILKKIRENQNIVGRQKEIESLALTLLAGRNVLIEGPVGVGKTALAQAVASTIGRSVIRVDGDSRFTEQKLTGWFDPALVLKKGFSKKTFSPGPLVEAMSSGSILFINELNRMPEAVQNVLLPAIDEGFVQIPQLGTIEAKSGFLLLATQNPREFVATSHLSEALLDRMEWLPLHYQTLDEELQIVRQVTEFLQEPTVSYAVEIVRLTRNHPKIKRGASVRAAIAIIEILKGQGFKEFNEDVFLAAVQLALPNRIELNSLEFEGSLESQILSLAKELYLEVKKKTR